MKAPKHELEPISRVKYELTSSILSKPELTLSRRAKHLTHGDLRRWLKQNNPFGKIITTSFPLDRPQVLIRVEARALGGMRNS